MFQNLKSKNPRKGKWKDMPKWPDGEMTGYSHAPSATTFSIKGNEGTRMVNCRVCGFPCDKERDSRAKPGSWAGIGVNQGEQLSAGTSIGDRRVPAAGVVATSVDKYYNRNVVGGCPACGCWDYDA